MMATGSESESPEPGFLDRWLAALILCGIAIAQLILANTGDLSPWKGGGFGMFATVDSPLMRTITAEGVDEDGNEVRIEAFDLMSESDRLRWRAWPDSALLERLADRMGSLEYVRIGSQRSVALERLREENPLLELPDGDGGGEWLRPRRAGDPEGGAKKLQAVRIEAWRMRYFAEENRIAMEALGEPVERGEWP